MNNTCESQEKASEPLRINAETIRSTLNNSKIPASFNMITFSHNGTPTDFVHLAINEAYKKLTGQTEDELVDKRFTDAFKERPENNAGLISLFASVALTGVPAEIDKYFNSLQKWVHISILSSEKNFFTWLLEDITEKKLLELELGGNNQNTPLMSKLDSGLWVINNQGITTYVNSKIACILGYSVNEILGRCFLKFLDDHEMEIIKDAWREKDSIDQIEIAFIRKDGTPIYALVYTSLLLDGAGDISGKIMRVIDISERKRFEEILSKTQTKYQSLFQNMAEGFAYFQVLFDQLGNPVDFVFSDVNEAFRRLVGLQNRAVLGRRIGEVFPILRKDLFDWFKLIGNVSVGRNIAFEKYVPQMNKWLSLHAYSSEKGYFAVILEDVTSRKRIEQDLRKSEKRYKQLADSITDLFFAVNSSLKFTYWNKASEIFTGLGNEEVIEHRFFDVFGKEDDVAQRIAKICLNTTKTKKPHAYTGRLPKFHGDRIFDVYFYPTGNGISILAKDVTERKKLQETLEHYAQHLEELVKIRTEKLRGAERFVAIGETAGMIGHDIRNPLQSIIGELYLAKNELQALDDCATKENLSESIRFIEEQTVYINKIVSDLQDYSKEIAPVIEETNVEELVKAVTSKLDVPDDIKVSYSVTKPFPAILTDPLFLTRILTNLALNGLQAIPDSGGELTINSSIREQKVIITVADTGKGIPDEIKSKIFKPLFTTKPKGQGFGLAVVKKLVEGLNGTVCFETSIGKGTKFIVEIPFLKE